MWTRAKISAFIILQLFFVISVCQSNATEIGSCGDVGGRWVTTFSGCSDDPDRQGAFCNIYQCYCGPDFDPSPSVKRYKCAQPAWLPPASRCPYLLREVVSEWRCNDELDCRDQDGDGYYGYAANCTQGDDCDDANPLVYPGTEGCGSSCQDNDGDGICSEDDCDGDTSHNPGNICCTDADGDGYAVEGGSCGDVDCNDSDPALNIATSKTCTEDEDCQKQIPTGSTSNVATGELDETIELFNAGGSVPLGFSAYYNSQDAFSGALGTSWSHNYEYQLTEQPRGNVLLRTPAGKYQLYTLSGSTYTTEPGDYNLLAKNATGLFALTRPNGTVYTFGANHKIASIVDRNGNNLSFTYNGDDLVEVTDSNGRSIQFNTAGGILTSVTDPAGNVYQFDVTDTLYGITFPDGSAWQFNYQENAYMTSKTDPAGNLTSYFYDSQMRIIEAIDPQGRSRSIDYPENDEDVRTTAFTEKDGSVWLYTYDVVSGDLVSKTDPEGNVTGYTYDVSHNLIAKTEPDVGTSFFAYDSNGNLTAVTDAAGNATSTTYNSFGQVTSVTNASEETTTYEYDEHGNLIKVTDPQGNSRTYQYDDQGRLISITSATGETTQLRYDTQGNIASVTGPDGQTTTFSYDANGNRLSLTDAQGNTTRYEYDVKGQLIKVTDTRKNVTLYSYDANGNRSSVTDANGKITTFTYNFEGQMISMTDGMGFVTQFEYSGSAGCSTCSGGVDKLTALTDAKGQTTNFKYDALGNLIKEIDPLGKMTEYGYDAAGRVASKTDPNGNIITYSYDPLGRLSTKTYPDGSQTTFSYDVEGNLTAAANRHITYTFAYDANDRLIEATDSFGHMLTYSYDPSGNRTAMHSSQGIDVVYRYDAAGRLGTIQSGAETFTFSYDNLGRRSLLSFPNGVAATYQYDGLGRLTDLVTATGTEIIAGNHYAHDAVGNRLSNQDVRHTASYTYDDIYRLAEAISNTPGNSAVNDKRSKSTLIAIDNQKEFYQYDAVGNRTASSEHNSYQHNSDNQLIAASSIQYRYDANGNRTARTSPEGTTTYTWDYENRLVGVTTPEGSIIRYAYDPFGRRIAKTVNGSTTRYTYDSEDILFETDNGSIGNIYIHGPGIDEPLALLGKMGTSYYHADGLGSIVAMTDDLARNVQQYEYDSFGNLHDMKNRIKQPYTYTGREYDRETGLYYYRARYYDGEVGRFISEDPIGFAGEDFNYYAYVFNDPINWIDPWGLRRWHSPDGTHTVGRSKTIVPPGGKIGTRIENNVGSGYTFGQYHDAFVEIGVQCGIPDPIINIPSMLPVYLYAISVDMATTPVDQRPPYFPVFTYRW